MGAALVLVLPMYLDLRPPRPHSHPAPRPPRRRVRPAHLATLTAVSVAAIGLMGLKFVTLPQPDPVGPGEGLKIEVVAPVEPELSPGSIMDVGELVDGFHYVPPGHGARAPVLETAWLEDEDSGFWSRPAVVRRHAPLEAETPPPEPEPPRRERGRRWFGFDNPLPDFEAERRARQARLDALEDQRRAEFDDRRRYSSSERYEQPRYERRYEPPRQERRRDERPHDEPGDGPWGPEVG